MFAQSMQLMFTSFEVTDCDTLIMYLQALLCPIETLPFTGHNLPEL